MPRSKLEFKSGCPHQICSTTKFLHRETHIRKIESIIFNDWLKSSLRCYDGLVRIIEE
jgi:hypothetical protein